MQRAEAFAPYAFAASRKIEIARYHQRELEGWRESDPIAEDVPPIELQAHFEGSLRAVVSLADQVGSGLAVALQGTDLKLPPVKHAYIYEVAQALPSSVVRSKLIDWRAAPIAEDVWAIRNTSTHRHYGKARVGMQWEVAEPSDSTAYDDSREVCVYVAAAVDHAQILYDYIPVIKKMIDEVNE